MGGGPLRFGAGIEQQPCRPGMCALALGRRQRLIHGGADHRMHEPQRRVRTQHLDSRQSAGRLRRGAGIETGELAREPRISIVAQHRDRLRQARRLARKAGEANRHRAGSRPRRDQMHTRCVGGDRREALGCDGMHQLTQEQRVAAGLLMAGHAERMLGLRRRALAQQPGGSINRQSPRSHDRRKRVRHDPADERLVLARLRRPQGSDHQ